MTAHFTTFACKEDSSGEVVTGTHCSNINHSHGEWINSLHPINTTINSKTSMATLRISPALATFCCLSAVFVVAWAAEDVAPSFDDGAAKPEDLLIPSTRSLYDFVFADNSVSEVEKLLTNEKLDKKIESDKKEKREKIRKEQQEKNKKEKKKKKRKEDIEKAKKETTEKRREERKEVREKERKEENKKEEKKEEGKKEETKKGKKEMKETSEKAKKDREERIKKRREKRMKDRKEERIKERGEERIRKRREGKKVTNENELKEKKDKNEKTKNKKDMKRTRDHTKKKLKCGSLTCGKSTRCARVLLPSASAKGKRNALAKREFLRCVSIKAKKCSANKKCSSGRCLRTTFKKPYRNGKSFMLCLQRGRRNKRKSKTGEKGKKAENGDESEESVETEKGDKMRRLSKKDKKAKEDKDAEGGGKVITQSTNSSTPRTPNCGEFYCGRKSRCVTVQLPGKLTSGTEKAVEPRNKLRCVSNKAKPCDKDNTCKRGRCLQITYRAPFPHGKSSMMCLHRGKSKKSKKSRQSKCGKSRCGKRSRCARLHIPGRPAKGGNKAAKARSVLHCISTKAKKCGKNGVCKSGRCIHTTFRKSYPDGKTFMMCVDNKKNKKSGKSSKDEKKCGRLTCTGSSRCANVRFPNPASAKKKYSRALRCFEPGTRSCGTKGCLLGTACA